MSTRSLTAVGEPTWLQAMATALEACQVDEQGNIPADAYLAAMEKIPPVYEALFSYKMVVNILKKDIFNAAQSVREGAHAVPPPSTGVVTLNMMVMHELRCVGNSTSNTEHTPSPRLPHLLPAPRRHAHRLKNVSGIEKDKSCGSHSLLWLNRASTFMTTFMRGMYDGAEPKAAAQAAYAKVLEPCVCGHSRCGGLGERCGLMEARARLVGITGG
jgi:hypothetical protein